MAATLESFRRERRLGHLRLLPPESGRAIVLCVDLGDRHGYSAYLFARLELDLAEALGTPVELVLHSPQTSCRET
jgi:hypothetical protein